MENLSGNLALFNLKYFKVASHEEFALLGISTYVSALYDPHGTTGLQTVRGRCFQQFFWLNTMPRMEHNHLFLFHSLIRMHKNTIEKGASTYMKFICSLIYHNNLFTIPKCFPLRSSRFALQSL